MPSYYGSVWADVTDETAAQAGWEPAKPARREDPRKLYRQALEAGLAAAFLPPPPSEEP